MGYRKVLKDLEGYMIIGGFAVATSHAVQHLKHYTTKIGQESDGIANAALELRENVLSAEPSTMILGADLLFMGTMAALTIRYYKENVFGKKDDGYRTDSA